MYGVIGHDSLYPEIISTVKRCLERDHPNLMFEVQIFLDELHRSDKVANSNWKEDGF